MKNPFLFKTSFVFILFLAGMAGLSLFPQEGIGASLLDPFQEEEIHLVRGDLETVKTYNLTRVSISDPAIADMADVNADGILLLATSPGSTTLFLWDDYGKRNVMVRVFADNLEMVKGRLEYRLARADIEGIDMAINKTEGKIILSGEIDKEKKAAFDQMIGPFDANLLNLVKEKKDEELIQIDAMIAELTSTFTKSLGVDWTGLSAVTYTESDYGNKKIDKAGDLFKLGDFKRTTGITATLNAAITEGKGRVLSKPKLVVISGQNASFNVGGEIPVVTTTTSSGGNVSESVDYRSYGVNLSISPTLQENGLIAVNLNISVSDIDAANAVGGNAAFTSRTASTQLLLEDSQTVVLAGLLKQNEGETVTRIPFLSDIPVVGALFRTKTRSPDAETELVITLTPTVIQQRKKEAKNAISQDSSVKIVPSFYEENLSSQEGPVAKGSQAYIPIGAMITQNLIPEEMISYVRLLQERIARNVGFPAQARREGRGGTVKLSLLVLNDGTLADASVIESSGQKMFDDNALNAAKRLAPYEVFPPETNLQEITVTIPIVYSLQTE